MRNLTHEDIEIGVEFYECGRLGCVRYKATSEVSETTTEINGQEFKQFSWKAVEIEDEHGNEVDDADDSNYLVTEGHEHYGPKMYSYRAYVSPPMLPELS